MRYVTYKSIQFKKGLHAFGLQGPFKPSQEKVFYLCTKLAHVWLQLYLLLILSRCMKHEISKNKFLGKYCDYCNQNAPWKNVLNFAAKYIKTMVDVITGCTLCDFFISSFFTIETIVGLTNSCKCSGWLHWLIKRGEGNFRGIVQSFF